MPYTRRTFLRNTGIGLLTFTVGGCRVAMSPREAHQQELPFQVLQADQVRTLEPLGEVLLPGSVGAGLVHFIDHQLAASSADQMLMIKYLGVSPPFAPFYQQGLAALDASSLSAHALRFDELVPDQQVELVRGMSESDPEGWTGPPAPFFYFILRNDAVDVVYGTKQGIESLGIPFMAHIEPPSRWGE